MSATVALWIVLGILAFLFLLTLLRVGVIVTFGTALTVTAHLGPFRMQLVPAKEKKPKTEKEKAKPEEKKKEKPAAAKNPVPKPDWKEIRSALPFFWRLLKKTLRRTRRRILISPMQLSFVFGGDDSVKISEWYGAANTLVWTYMPQLEELIHFRKPYIHLGTDFQAEKTKAEGTVGFSFLILDLLIIGLGAGIPALRWYQDFKKKSDKKLTKNAIDATKTAENTTA